MGRADRMRWIATAGALALAVGLFAGCASSGNGASGVAPVHFARPDTTPPSPTPTPIQLQYGTTIGTVTWPDDDTATGGQGKPVESIYCRAQMDNTYHHHAQLTIFVNGAQLAIPKGTGMFKPSSGSGGFIYHAKCFYWLHTHDQTGIIHIEPPDGRAFTLGQWFKIWGEPVGTNQIAQFTGPVSVYINGALQPGMDPRSVTLTPYEEITLVIGTPPSWIPQYLFPPGYP